MTEGGRELKGRRSRSNQLGSRQSPVTRNPIKRKPRAGGLGSALVSCPTVAAAAAAAAAAGAREALRQRLTRGNGTAAAANVQPRLAECEITGCGGATWGWESSSLAAPLTSYVMQELHTKGIKCNSALNQDPPDTKLHPSLVQRHNCFWFNSSLTEENNVSIFFSYMQNIDLNI